MGLLVFTCDEAMVLSYKSKRKRKISVFLKVFIVIT